MAASAPYEFKPHERPTLPGSPATPDHPTPRRIGYFAIGLLVGLTGALGNALIAVNLNLAQGTLGLYANEAAWLPAAYAMTNVCANLLLVKYRQQFGLQPFIRWILLSYILATLAHLFVHDFWSSVLVRAVSGIAAAGLSTLTVLYLMQSMPAPKRLVGLMLGITLPQLATPLARLLSPWLFEWGEWRMAYTFELGLALACLAAVMRLPLPPSERHKAFERTDFLTMALFAPGLGLLIAVLAQGRIVWWTDAAWIGWALVGAVVLIVAALLIEHYRANPLINTRWLGRREMIRLAVVATSVRILLSEQSVGSIGLLGVVGMGNDQLVTLNLIICLASIAGVAAMLLTFNPRYPGRPISIAVALIAIGSFMDAHATNLTRPANFYVSQGLIAFASVYFLGPAIIIGISRTLLAGPKHFISFIVLFGITQNLGGFIGSALLGSFQTLRVKYHYHELVQNLVLTNPLVAAQVRGGAGAVSGVVTDPVLRNAEGVTLLAQQALREANILAYNDVFMLAGVLAILAFVYGVGIQFQMWMRGEKSPAILLQERMQSGKPQ